MKIKLMSLIVLSFFILSSYNVLGLKTEISDNVNISYADIEISITIDYVTNKPDGAKYLQSYDPIDGPASWNPEPEWCYQIEVSDYSNPEIKETINNENKNDGWISQYTWNVDETHDFSAGYTNPDSVIIKIRLWDNDIVTNEAADISAEKGDNDEKKYFTAYYNFIENKLEGCYVENAFIDEGNGWYVIHGELDGTTDSEDGNNENDAEMQFKIEDNIEPLSVTLDIQNKDIMENRNIPPDTAVKFICKVEGGLPGFEYHFIPRYKPNHQEIVKISDERQFTFEYTYSKSDHKRFNPYIYVKDRDGNGLSANSEMDDIYVNRRPDAEKTIVTGVPKGWQYTAHASDPDNDYLQYRFKINRRTTTDWDYTNIYYHRETAKLDSFEFQVRDDPNNDGKFGDGLKSHWESEVSRVKEKDLNLLTLIQIFFEKLSFLRFFSFQ
jgi:hypothetical protein